MTVDQVVIEALETTSKSSTHWSTPSLATKHRISPQTVSEICPVEERAASIMATVKRSRGKAYTSHSPTPYANTTWRCEAGPPSSGTALQR
jgi:hypothetical protein